MSSKSEHSGQNDTSATLKDPSITTAMNAGTNLKEYNNLMPKTIEEIREIQARGRRLLIKKKYIRKPRPGLQSQPPKSEEQLILEKMQKEKDIRDLPMQIVYSAYYKDEAFEYRHVVLPKDLARWLPQNQLLKPQQWIDVGVHQSTGWEHYMIYKPEPHILMFKREKDYLQKYGDHNPQYPPELWEQMKKQLQLQQLQQEQAKSENPNTKKPFLFSPPLLPAPDPLSPPPHHHQHQHH